MVRTRVRTFAAALALGAAAPLTAQPPADEPSFVVLPPRALPLPKYALDPTSAEIPVGFFTSAPQPNAQPPAAPAPQAAQVRPFWLTAPQSQNALNTPAQSQPRPNPGAFQMQPLTGGVPKPKSYPALTSPMSAPAWRWHGYGTVMPGDAQPSTPGALTAANAALGIPMLPTITAPYPSGPVLPHPSAPQPMPMGAPVSVGDPSGLQALPSYAPAPAAPEALPFPPAAASGDAGWKPSERLGVVPTNPMTADPAVVPAVAQGGQQGGWTPAGPSVVPAAFRSRATDVGESDASPARPTFVPATVAPTQPPAPPTAETLTNLHSAIERLIVGRGSELELFQRNSTSLLVRFKVRQAADAESLANAISKIAGLTAFQVVYEIGIIP